MTRHDIDIAQRTTYKVRYFNMLDDIVVALV